MGTMVKVKNLRNGREVTVRINNRGPHIRGRIIDLSTRAARELRMVDAGIVPVEITTVPSGAVAANH
jgi:rare lipoprotein A